MTALLPTPTSYQRLVRWLFTRLYQEFAWLYDVIAALVSWGYWHRWVATLADHVHGDVLELGCGTGYLQAELLRRAGPESVIGLDLSRQMLAITQQRCQQNGLPAHLLRANAQHIPLAAQRFDTVIATFPSEYIFQPQTLAEAQRLLRPGGRLLIVLSASLPGPGWYRTLLDLAYRLTLQAAAPQTQQPDDVPQTVAALPEYLQAAFQELGLNAHSLSIQTQFGQLYGILAECA